MLAKSLENLALDLGSRCRRILLSSDTHRKRHLAGAILTFFWAGLALQELTNSDPMFAQENLLSRGVNAATGADIRAHAFLLAIAVNLAAAFFFYIREQKSQKEGRRKFLVSAAYQAGLFAFLALLYTALYRLTRLAPNPFHLPERASPFFYPLSMITHSAAYTVFLVMALRLLFRSLQRPTDDGQRDRVERGNDVIRDTALAAQAFRARIHPESKVGLELSSGLRLPLAMESRHILITGAPGSGKTQAIFPWVADVVGRQWRTLVYDFKGDYTEAYGEADFTAILTPFDARGWAWDIAQDIQSTIDASEFAVGLIPHHNAREPFFRLAAQDLLTGVVVKLQQEKPLTWGLADLVEILTNRDQVVEACRRYRPGALNALGNLDDRQAGSVLAELRTGTIQLEYLADAWRGNDRRLSLRAWVTNDQPATGPQLIILKGSQQYRELDGFFTALVFNILAKTALSLPDSYERQIWTFLDEFGNLPRLAGFDKLLTAVRSKGLRIVAAIQDIAQIEETYGRAFTQTFFGAFGTVLAGVASGDTAAFLARAYGQNQIARTLTSHTSTGAHDTDSSTVSETVVIENALLDSEFSGLPPPGPGRPAIFWLKTAGWPIGPIAYWTKATQKLYPAERPNERLIAHRPQPAPAAPLYPRK